MLAFILFLFIITLSFSQRVDARTFAKFKNIYFSKTYEVTQTIGCKRHEAISLKRLFRIIHILTPLKYFLSPSTYQYLYTKCIYIITLYKSDRLAKISETLLSFMYLAVLIGYQGRNFHAINCLSTGFVRIFYSFSHTSS